MKERQRWTADEDALLRSYVKRHGPREWSLVSQRMNAPSFQRDAKSCLERWKNYLTPTIKKGSLTEDEQLLVIRLQAKHGNKWKKIAAEVPGRTAKRLGKWWEVFKEKQRRIKEKSSSVVQIEPKKYDQILESFAEKLVGDGGNRCCAMAAPVFPPWLSTGANEPPSPSVALTLSPFDSRSNHNAGCGDNHRLYELAECSREVEEGYHALAAHRKETAWRMKRVELQLEAERASRRREKMEEIEAKIRALREEQFAALDRIDGEYAEEISSLRREAEAKEQKLAEQWAAAHARMNNFFQYHQTLAYNADHMNMNGR